MYISSTIIGIIIILLLAFYALKKSDLESKHSIEIDKIKEKHRQDILEIYNKQQTEKQLETLKDIQYVFNCNCEEAKKVYNLLNDTHHLYEFEELKSNEEKITIFENALSHEKFYSNTLLPIIKANNYTISLSDYSWFRDVFKEKKDITIETKLLQIELDYCINTKKLFEIVTKTNLEIDFESYYFIKKNTKETNISYICHDNYLYYDDLIKIADELISHFNLNIKKLYVFDIEYYILKENHYYSTSELLEHIFALCLYLSKLVSAPDYYTFYSYVCRLFFFRPYYDIDNCKQLIIDHIEELEKINQD